MMRGLYKDLPKKKNDSCGNERLHLDIHGALSMIYGCHMNSAHLRVVLES